MAGAHLVRVGVRARARVGVRVRVRVRVIDLPFPNALAWQTPHPAAYRLVWSKTLGDQPLFAWEAEPPSDAFVCLGMLFTTTSEPPALGAMRCVHRAWTRQVGVRVRG